MKSAMILMICACWGADPVQTRQIEPAAPQGVVSEPFPRRVTSAAPVAEDSRSVERPPPGKRVTEVPEGAGAASSGRRLFVDPGLQTAWSEVAIVDLSSWWVPTGEVLSSVKRAPVEGDSPAQVSRGAEGAQVRGETEGSELSEALTRRKLRGVIIRGQSPRPYDDPADAPRFEGDLGRSPSVPASPYQILPGQTSPYGDPFLGGGVGPSWEQGMESGLPSSAVGPQPYKFGWTHRYDVGFLSQSGASGGRGTMSTLEANAAWRFTNGWPEESPLGIFSWTPEVNYRGFNGPRFPDLPGDVYRLASDFELATPGNAPVSLQLGFTPALATDFGSGWDRETFNFDGRAVAFVRVNPQFMLALGAMYWDRVDDRVIPYVGFVCTPNDQWEFRILFPKSRISWFIGDPLGIGSPTWLYVAAEYNVESYQIALAAPNNSREHFEIEDYRATIGLRTDNGMVGSFIEAGWVFGRNVNFRYGTPGFDLNDGFLIRAGLRF